jgi:hypothetical protein
MERQEPGEIMAVKHEATKHWRGFWCNFFNLYPRPLIDLHYIHLALHNGQLALERAPLINTNAIDEDRKACYYASSKCRQIPIYGVPPIYFGFIFLFFGAASLCLSLCGFAIKLSQANKSPHWILHASILVGAFAVYLISHASNLILIGRYSLPSSPSAPLDRRSEDICVLPVVVTELEFCNIERHIFPAHFVECADHATLEDRPKAFDGLSVDRSDDILTARMVNSRVWIIPIKRIVAGILIGAKQADLMGDGFADEGGKSVGSYVRDNTSDHIALAANSADEWSFAGTDRTAPQGA